MQPYAERMAGSMRRRIVLNALSGVRASAIQVEPVAHAQQPDRAEAHGGQQNQALEQRLPQRIEVEDEQQIADGAKHQGAEDRADRAARTAEQRHVLSMADMKGFRLRLISSPLKVNVWKAVGAIPTPIAFMETYLAMKSGVVDGMENESVAVRDMKFYEPAPYIARTEHEFTVRPMFMSKKSFDKLPPKLQQIVLKDAQEATVFERKLEVEANITAEKDMQEKLGVKFNAIDKEPFKVATKPVIAEFATSMGLTDLLRSVERRVGQECRSRRSPYH